MENTLDDMTSKDAFFALDTTMEEDMVEYGKEVTALAVKHINSTPELYNFVKNNQEHGVSIKNSAIEWANNHNEEFGDLFITELDIVNWKGVQGRV